MNITRLARIGDTLAIPIWIALIYYFWNLSEERPLTLFEKALFVFAIGGLIADFIFVFYS
jgi:hypothetical protein